MKRALLCLSSLPRHLEVGLDSLNKHVLQHVNWPMDVAAHFPEPPHQAAVELIESFADHYEICVETDPKVILPDAYSENLMDNQQMRGNLLQWLSMKRCASMKEAFEEKYGPYQLVIWSRPDLYFLQDFCIPEEVQGLGFSYMDGHNGVNDRFCYGDSKSMSLRMKIYDYFVSEWYDKYHKDKKHLKKKRLGWFKYAYRWNPEMVLKDMLLDYHIPYRTEKFLFGKLRKHSPCPICGKETCFFVSVPQSDNERIHPDLKDINFEFGNPSPVKVHGERTFLYHLNEV